MSVSEEQIRPAESGDGTEWRRSAACRDVDPEVFFPDAASGSAPDPVSDPVSDGKRRIAQAKAVCAGCPVQQECRREAVERREPVGIWGGTTPQQRAALRRKQRRSKAGQAARRTGDREAVLLGDRIHRAERSGARSPADEPAACARPPSSGAR
ncbi:WhiB family transcriptional regulator [Actinomadura decatromicini]|uniref:Transcriptional regulator WhiB n=1 Tax=Actinomadura decatromicini TaxID=2604572 RepID=A0A5D3F5W1_9ACTN|nr:WhiB family transcriptional regulator [Actinomadura decatromicini]TYK43060.1 WhiB family transcriptional regulator [Actinomadura decatromicini]